MDKITQSRPVGYQWLVDHYGLNCLPADRISRVAGVSAPRTKRDFVTGSGDTVTLQTFPWRYAKANTFQDHLELALKYEGINPGILKAVFQEVGPKAVEEYVRSTPTGQYAKRAWFFYEWLTGKQLDIQDLKISNNIDAVDPDEYYVAPPISSPRHRVINNVAGVPGYCPMFRRSEYIDSIIAKDLPRHLMVQLRQHSQDVLERTMNYLYAKESRTSHLIEREVPSAEKAARFVKLLREAGGEAPLTDEAVFAIQVTIIDEKRLHYGYGWRPVQGYVSETRFEKQIIHEIGAKPEDVPGLMHDLFAYMERLHGSNVPPIIQAAAVAFGFVFIHPLEDGNGRAHRYLIHHVLSREKYTPRDIIFPVSAAILNDQKRYEICLETFSKPLMRRVTYTKNKKGEMQVTTKNTADFYRYFNGTPIAEYLTRMIEKTAQEEVMQEIAFIELYDSIKTDVKAKLHNISDRDLDLAIKVIHQNGGKISKRKSDGILTGLSEADRLLFEEAYAKYAYDIRAAGMELPQPEF